MSETAEVSSPRRATRSKYEEACYDVISKCAFLIVSVNAALSDSEEKTFHHSGDDGELTSQQQPFSGSDPQLHKRAASSQHEVDNQSSRSTVPSVSVTGHLNLSLSCLVIQMCFDHMMRQSSAGCGAGVGDEDAQLVTPLATRLAGNAARRQGEPAAHALGARARAQHLD